MLSVIFRIRWAFWNTHHSWIIRICIKCRLNSSRTSYNTLPSGVIPICILFERANRHTKSSRIVSIEKIRATRKFSYKIIFHTLLIKGITKAICCIWALLYTYMGIWISIINGINRAFCYTQIQEMISKLIIWTFCYTSPSWISAIITFRASLNASSTQRISVSTSCTIKYTTPRAIISIIIRRSWTKRYTHSGIVICPCINRQWWASLNTWPSWIVTISVIRGTWTSFNTFSCFVVCISFIRTLWNACMGCILAKKSRNFWAYNHAKSSRIISKFVTTRWNTFSTELFSKIIHWNVANFNTTICNIICKKIIISWTGSITHIFNVLCIKIIRTSR